MAVVVPKSYYTVLSRNNAFNSSETLTTPFYNVSACRIISNSLSYIQANFLYNSYNANADGTIEYLEGFALAGDPALWYKVKLGTIIQPVVSLYNPNAFYGDSLQLCFQFI
jgi:hypothetical protein